MPKPRPIDDRSDDRDESRDARERREKDDEYDALKEHEGKRYTGMKVGGSHKWYYDQGEWRERKVLPEEWDVSYQTVKRRAGKAPKESGVPVGTKYNWLIVAHQLVDKIDANSYATCLEGKKFKVAHKRAGKDAWSAKEKAQRKKVIAFLEQVIADLKAADDGHSTFTTGAVDRVYGLEHFNKDELYEIAVEHDIPGRSKMKRDELLGAVKQALYGHE